MVLVTRQAVGHGLLPNTVTPRLSAALHVLSPNQWTSLGYDRFSKYFLLLKRSLNERQTPVFQIEGGPQPLTNTWKPQAQRLLDIIGPEMNLYMEARSMSCAQGISPLLARSTLKQADSEVAAHVEMGEL
ncbi:hypothetical protein RRG08_019241 [Elysia crispata]|uniref:Uncharacterized protein n=1 Tax=Elysia crispata TaxID=231223 RepID=A0AAE1ATN4_9GAST|nr:hypothetical protein RRG08_019241 [Elysia crispata]